MEIQRISFVSATNCCSIACLQKPLVLLQDSLIKSFTSLLLRDAVYILLCPYCSLNYHSLRHSLAGSARIDTICARPRHLPSTPLVGIANGISSAESNYITQRYSKASIALTAFLKTTNATFSVAKLPVVALTTSGGGYCSLLTGAGVIQGFDSRDSNTSVSGLFQALTYEAGLSGGA